MFYDRYEAGRDLADELIEYEASDAVICAIPRGGILTGVAVAKRLQLPLEIMVVSKIEHVSEDAPLYCAVTEYGTYTCGSIGTLPDTVVHEAAAQAIHKRQDYTESVVQPQWKGKTVIVVDDGAESGLTIQAVVEALRDQGAATIIVALPAANTQVIHWLEEHADQVFVITSDPEFTGRIIEHYSHYPEVFDKEVRVAYWHAKHMYEQRTNQTA